MMSEEKENMTEDAKAAADVPATRKPNPPAVKKDTAPATVKKTPPAILPAKRLRKGSEEDAAEIAESNKKSRAARSSAKPGGGAAKPAGKDKPKGGGQKKPARKPARPPREEAPKLDAGPKPSLGEMLSAEMREKLANRIKK